LYLGAWRVWGRPGRPVCSLATSKTDSTNRVFRSIPFDSEVIGGRN
jgi:hypothetical protein